ncbi:hypothetical protein SDC9_152982 [bioreactor metagenome]|uniref:Uncharacterized protein n=1 Tax=bioreactor metagenome TaxID=1076179 RepID=A0A645EX01_9ZZZZ
MPVGVEEVDGLEQCMIGGTDHLDASSFKAGLSCKKRIHGLDFQRQVLGPRRGVAVTPHRWAGRQLKEGEHVTIAGVEENMHVGIRLARGRNGILGNGQHEFHAQVLLVPARGLQRVLAAVGDVVNFIDQH